MKDFHEHWMDRDEIFSFRVMSVGIDSFPVIVHFGFAPDNYNTMKGCTDFANGKLYICQENDDYWIAVINLDGKEIERYNTRFVLDIVWKD